MLACEALTRPHLDGKDAVEPAPLRVPMISLDFPARASSASSILDPSPHLPSAEEIVSGSEALALAGEPEGWMEVLKDLGAPALDVSVTATGARASLLGLETGRGFYHHELRVRLPMPPALEPEIAVGDDGSLPFWSKGALVEPKYFSFFQDAQLPAYNPNHRGKWRAHEMMHGALRHFWSPRMTRFECYLGTRLNELLPLALWYGFDEIHRPRCPKHLGKTLYRTHCYACESLARPFWETSPERLKTDHSLALSWAQEGLDYIKTEWAACRQELESGQRVEIPRARLDSSSDSLGYVRGHWNRLTAWSFGAWTESFMIPGVDYFDDMERYFEHASSVALSWLGGPLQFDPKRAAALRKRKMLQDIGYRAYILMESAGDDTPDGIATESAIQPHLDFAAHLCRQLLEPGSEDLPIRGVMENLSNALRPLNNFDNTLRDDFSAMGYAWPSAAKTLGVSEAPYFASRDQVIEGIETAMPQTVEALGEEMKPLCEAFISSDLFHDTSSLPGRFACWYSGYKERDAAVSELAHFESWIIALPRRDEEAEDFASLPEDFAELRANAGSLRLHQTLRRSAFSRKFAVKNLGVEIQGDPEHVSISAIYKRGEASIVSLDPDAEFIIETLKSSSASLPLELLNIGQQEALLWLLNLSFVVWFPSPAPKLKR